MPSSPQIQTANALPLDAFRASYFPSSISSTLPLPLPFPHNLNLDLTLTLESPSSLPPEALEQCLNLIASTSASAYRNSSVGWSPAKKRREMKAREMKYLLLRGRGKSKSESEGIATAVHDAAAENGDGAGAAEPAAGPEPEPEPEDEGTIQGFCSFKLTYEETCSAVLYIYELHLVASLRSSGLGSMLMSTVETIGRQIGVKKAMLTCFVENVHARRFYEGKLKYVVDEGSPREEGEEEGVRKLRGGRGVKMRGAGYVILSKTLNLKGEVGENKKGVKRKRMSGGG